MAERSVYSFGFDDDDYAGGGFGADLKGIPKELLEEVGDTADDAPVLEPEQEESPEPEEKPEPEPEEKPEPKKPEAKKPNDSIVYDYLLAQTARQAAALEEANKKLAELSKKPAPSPTEEDWISNPEAAARAIISAEREKAESAERESRENALRQSQDAQYRQMIKAVPGFETDQVLRQRWASVFWTNPEYVNSPDGPLMAAQEVHRLFYSQQEEAKPINTPPAEPSRPAPGRDDARIAALKKGAMHGSGRGGGKARVQGLDPELAKWGRKMGVSEESLRKVAG